MGGICGMNGSEEKGLQYFGEKAWGKELLGRFSRSVDNNIKMGFKEAGLEDVNLNRLAVEAD